MNRGLRSQGRSPAQPAPASSGARRRAKTLLGPAKKLLARENAPFENVETRALCDGVRARLRERAAARGVDIHVYRECSHVRVQRAPFAEALYELTSNAVEAAAPGRAVILEVRSTLEGDVVWQIHDHGEGMSEDALRELGLPTAGLGVVLAWAIVEHHGGLLHFDSAPGGGTTATIWLPVEHR